MGFETSDPKIYQKMQLKGQLKQIADKDFVSILHPFSKHGFFWNKGKMERVGFFNYESFDTPWCHAKHLVGKHCSLDFNYTFKLFGVIHPRCMSCWKTCVTLKNFDELMTWYKIQNNELGIASKCGIELRDYVPKFYGAYHYADSLDSGREMYEFVKKFALKYLSKETAEGVILKRACTEYEMIQGPSSNWHLTDVEENIINLIERYVEFPMKNNSQDKIIGHPHVHMKWALFAHMNGDMSYLPYNDETPLFPGYQKYHKGDIQGIKHDIGIMQAQSKYNLPPEISEEFLLGTSKFAKDHNIKLNTLAPVLGYERQSPFGVMDYSGFLNEIDPETIGEGDNEPKGEVADESGGDE